MYLISPFIVEFMNNHRSKSIMVPIVFTLISSGSVEIFSLFVRPDDLSPVPDKIFETDFHGVKLLYTNTLTRFSPYFWGIYAAKLYLDQMNSFKNDTNKELTYMNSAPVIIMELVCLIITIGIAYE